MRIAPYAPISADTVEILRKEGIPGLLGAFHFNYHTLSGHIQKQTPGSVTYQAFRPILLAAGEDLNTRLKNANDRYERLSTHGGAPLRLSNAMRDIDTLQLEHASYIGLAALFDRHGGTHDGNGITASLSKQSGRTLSHLSERVKNAAAAEKREHAENYITLLNDLPDTAALKGAVMTHELVAVLNYAASIESRGVADKYPFACGIYAADRAGISLPGIDPLKKHSIATGADDGFATLALSGQSIVYGLSSTNEARIIGPVIFEIRSGLSSAIPEENETALRQLKQVDELLHGRMNAVNGDESQFPGLNAERQIWSQALQAEFPRDGLAASRYSDRLPERVREELGILKPVDLATIHASAVDHGVSDRKLGDLLPANLSAYVEPAPVPHPVYIYNGPRKSDPPSAAETVEQRPRSPGRPSFEDNAKRKAILGIPPRGLV